MRAIGGSRLEWSDVSLALRGQIELGLGATVLDAANQAGGFSPGLAARCALSDGRRVFVKAVSRSQNEQALRMMRREIEVASQLPSSIPAPPLLLAVDDGHWAAAVFAEIDGRQPQEPWQRDELAVVAAAVRHLADVGTPAPIATLQSVQARHEFVFTGLRRFADGDGDLSRVDPWVAATIDDLASIEARWVVAAHGASLLHADIRADNVLIGPDDQVTFVDWPHACVGAAMVDAVFWLPSVGLGDGPDPAVVAEEHGLLEGVPDADIDAVLAAVTGFFLRSAQDPAPPGLPNLRAFQQAQADVAVRWLRDRLSR